jgi:hypothetical protein
MQTAHRKDHVSRTARNKRIVVVFGSCRATGGSCHENSNAILISPSKKKITTTTTTSINRTKQTCRKRTRKILEKSKWRMWNCNLKPPPQQQQQKKKKKAAAAFPWAKFT